jgi:metal transporter CNNM
MAKAETRSDSVTVQDPILSDQSGDERENLLSPAGKAASDGVHALQQGYGSMSHTASSTPRESRSSGHSPSRPEHGRFERHYSDRSRDNLESLDQHNHSPARAKRSMTRSGSITENIIEAGGIRKVVLETHSSSGEDKYERPPRRDPKNGGDLPKPRPSDIDEHELFAGEQSIPPKGEEVKKKRKRQRKKKGGKDEEDASAAGSSTQGRS